MSGWAHEQALELLEHKVEQGMLSPTGERRVRQQLEVGETARALRLLTRYDNRVENADRSE